MRSKPLAAGVITIAALSAGAWFVAREQVPTEPALAVAMSGAASGGGARADVEVTVYKTPTCGCCNGWADHLEQNGFVVRRVDVDDLGAVKDRHGVPQPLRTCHTAVVDGRIVEGHVPADEIWRFLEEDSDEAGIAVPGMPMGSPGMEGPRVDPYEIIAFSADGSARLFGTRN